ncbi:amino acid aminotransferase [Neisseria iguanae]|uniref:Aminotransferase n=1 Tax=Neisseria iguanae TaxID=90242 RepID=A0A2P7TXU5_9NEIS|nr:amino acid aminotransferase [Neisseria iguanae]PSJ79515.1 aromatic amino acid aminotransferase [Neisseria iguanae]
MFFDTIHAVPADPILGLGEAFKAETRAEKVNLGIGVYKNARGETPIVKAVKEAEKRLFESETSKNYLAIDGVDEYNAQTQILLFGAGHEIIASRRAKTAQSLGGTGALRVAAELAKHRLDVKNVWISSPTWPNHNAIFKAVGIEVRDYRYYNTTEHKLDWEGLIEDLSQVGKGDVVLLHGCCHNPTGIDPTPAQWDKLAQMSAEKGWLPLFDFAYQGFGNGLEEDAYSLRSFLKCNKELLIASSYSKNFGMYNERVGAFTVVAENEDTANRVHSQVKSIIRTLYSNPASHGANTIALVLKDADLKAQWIVELDEMRARIKAMRDKFVALLKAKGAAQDFDFIIGQNGIFSFSGLTPEQVDRLKNEFAIYIVRSGRINVAGMTDDNIDYLCESIVKVL